MAEDTTPGPLRGAIRSMRRSDTDRDEFANPKIAAAAALLLLLVPLLPFLAVVWTISKTLKGVRRRVSWE